MDIVFFLSFFLSFRFFLCLRLFFRLVFFSVCMLLHWPEAFNIILFPSILAAIFNRSRVSMCLSVCVCASFNLVSFSYFSLSLCAFWKGRPRLPIVFTIQCKEKKTPSSCPLQQLSFTLTFFRQPFFFLCLTKKKWTKDDTSRSSSTHNCMTLTRNTVDLTRGTEKWWLLILTHFWPIQNIVRRVCVQSKQNNVFNN